MKFFSRYYILFLGLIILDSSFERKVTSQKSLSTGLNLENDVYPYSPSFESNVMLSYDDGKNFFPATAKSILGYIIFKIDELEKKFEFGLINSEIEEDTTTEGDKSYPMFKLKETVKINESPEIKVSEFKYDEENELSELPTHKKGKFKSLWKKQDKSTGSHENSEEETISTDTPNNKKKIDIDEQESQSHTETSNPSPKTDSSFIEVEGPDKKKKKPLLELNLDLIETFENESATDKVFCFYVKDEELHKRWKKELMDTYTKENKFNLEDKYEFEETENLKKGPEHGNFGRIYLAQDKVTGEKVAIKQILNHKYDNSLSLIESEISILNALNTLNDKHIIKLEKVYIDQRSAFLGKKKYLNN